MSTNDPEKLEASIHRLLRSLPDRKAPVGLEARVLGELSRLASLPWWRRSYAYWPLAVRVAFFAGSAIAAALIVAGLIVLVRSSGANALAGGVADRFSWLILAREVVTAGSDKLRLLVGAIPSIWLYAAAGTVAACYATLAAIGAAAYRTLTFARQTS
jgi:hypothetical protein